MNLLLNSAHTRDLRSHLHPFTNLAAHAECGLLISTQN